MKNYRLLNIKENNQYHFKASKNDDPKRFILHFGEDPDKQTKELPARIYFDGGGIILDLTLVDQNAEVKIVDLTGRVLIHQHIEGKTIHSISLPSNNQIVLVLVQTANTSVCRKIYVP